ncbi:MAG: sigma-70 family RNA polymerase sigma factor [Steroidobacteraceae bacterium]|nr:sigma-70 family RNA polymerase sigma factor [Steroidobacteraceae bacterium]
MTPTFEARRRAQPEAAGAGAMRHAEEPVSSPVLPDVARGDRAAIGRCMARYGALVWSIARRLSPTTADAEDATQEVFLELWRSAGRFDPARGSERVFVAMIARRRLIDRLRTMRPRIEHELHGLDERANEVSVEPRADQAAEVAIARAVLETLPAEQRRVIDLSIVHGLSHSEIATRIGMPLGTVKTLVRRGLIKVRQALGVDAPRGAEAG